MVVSVSKIVGVVVCRMPAPMVVGAVDVGDGRVCRWPSPPATLNTERYRDFESS